MNTAATLVAGAAIFAGGLAVGRVTAGRTSTEVGAGHHVGREAQSPASADIADVLSRLQQLDDRLNRFATPPAVRAPLDSPSPDTSVADMITELKVQFEQLLADVHLQTSNIAEAARLKPAPDVDALRSLSRELSDDASKLMLRIAGMDYRYATRAFGTPTIK